MDSEVRACTAKGEDLNNQLYTCTLRERDANSLVETCAAREKHSVDQLEACNARANDLVDQFGACAAREKDSNTQLEACNVRGNDLTSQFEASAAREKACTSREKDLTTQLAASANREKTCTARENSLNDQLEASKKQVAQNAKTIADLQAEIAKLEKTYLKQKYKGCYVDVIPRMLNGAQKVGDATMTTEKCSTFCKNFTYFGTQYSQECYCGNQLKSAPVADSQCNMDCKGNNKQKCGGSMRLSVYQIL